MMNKSCQHFSGTRVRGGHYTTCNISLTQGAESQQSFSFYHSICEAVTSKKGHPMCISLSTMKCLKRFKQVSVGIQVRFEIKANNPVYE